MKKLIAILFAMLIVPSLVHSADRVISRFEVPQVASAIRVVCIDSHKFVYLNDIQFSKNRGIKGNTIANSIVQMFEERDGKSLPAKC
tara:strand:- start:433 stop:693 length:261 start_codon:yes stop_codon:yes gene_type:complete